MLNTIRRMIKVKQHKRIRKNGVTVVRRHFRGRYGLKPIHDKYPQRDRSGMDIETLKKHFSKYEKEFEKLLSGKETASNQHRLFIARRLQNVKRAILIKNKKTSDTN